MKRFTAALLSAALLFGLSGCDSQSGGDVDMTESKTALSAAEVSEAELSAAAETESTSETEAPTETAEAEKTADTAVEYTPDEEMLISFLSYLQNGGDGWGGYTNVYLDIFGNYDFMQDLKIDSYSYEHRGDGVYDVKLTCSESTCDMFPDGDSYWYADTRFGNFVFSPAEKEDKIVISTDMLDPDEQPAYRAAYSFTLCTGAFEADEEWFENYTDIDVHWFYHSYNPYVVMYEYDEETGESTVYDVTPEEFAAAVNKLYSINMTAEQAALMADGSGFMIKDCAHGGSWLYESYEGYYETDTEIKVRIDYYGDELYFYPVIGSEYTFSKNEDGTITLQRVEKIFERGYTPASGSI